eukprot:15456567-Alexandrium_andersonii.AAC.1
MTSFFGSHRLRARVPRARAALTAACLLDRASNPFESCATVARKLRETWLKLLEGYEQLLERCSLLASCSESCLKAASTAARRLLDARLKPAPRLLEADSMPA